jgi:uncharacterized protein YutD
LKDFFSEAAENGCRLNEASIVGHIQHYVLMFLKSCSCYFVLQNKVMQTKVVVMVFKAVRRPKAKQGRFDA